ncbi:hypothetical protein [Amycolatopsis rubida]|uniref:Uncharacterized protein n=1 Tax=Amycolatopsis rubida TaxID=112413 RepID=A0A1I5IGG9_9PSEU|nr:hypothetical protein [Amycolatopsis rubida]SFO59346.1 hypothetical protein SAMN05421854_102444 [Amycolatopsis rubida]
MTAAAHPRRSCGYTRRHNVGDENGVNPLYLFADWLRREPGFARPGPPRRPIRIRLVCKSCRAPAALEDHRCGECGESFWACGK